MTPIDKDQRLKLAVQKSGRLTDPSLELLKSCGLKLSRGRDQLMGFGENMPLDVLFVRDDDIPDLVQEDVCDLGLVGRNVLEEKRLELDLARPRRQLHRAAHARLRPLPAVAGGTRRLQLRGRRARSPANASRLPTRSRSSATCANATSRPTSSRLSGAVEIAPRLGRADLICDLVSTGSTLQANHLREVETVLREPGAADPHAGRAVPSQAGMGRAPAAAHRRRAAGDARASTSCCTRRARRCRRFAGCCRAASRRPSFRSKAPNDQVAIHAVCRENVFWETLESLKKAGASSLLVLPVEKMLV